MDVAIQLRRIEIRLTWFVRNGLRLKNIWKTQVHHTRLQQCSGLLKNLLVVPKGGKQIRRLKTERENLMQQKKSLAFSIDPYFKRIYASNTLGLNIKIRF